MIKKSINIILVFFILQTSIFSSGISYTNAPKATDIPARYASTPEYIKTVVSQNFALTNTIKDSELKFREKYRIYKPAVSGLNIMPIFIPDPDKVSAELSAFESAFNDGFVYNLSSLLYSQDAVIESEWDCDDEGHKWIVSTYVTCIKLDTGKMSLLDSLYDMAQQLHYHNPVQKSYELFEKYKCEGLVSQEDQAIDSLNVWQKSEDFDIYGNQGGNLYNFARYKLGKAYVPANHESINNHPKTPEAISKMLIKLDYIYEYDRNGRVVRKGTFFPKDGKF